MASVRTVSVRLIADISSFVSGMNRAGASASGFAGIAGKALGAAGIAGGFAVAVNAASEFESAMSGVQAATMGSASTMDDLRAAALAAGADTKFSATEAANAIKEMAKAGVSTADIMGGGLAGALSLAAAGQMEVAEAAEIASVAMTQFSLSGEDLPHVADLLAAGAGKAMGEVSDLGAALNQAGLVASAAGLSIEETTGTLSAFASAGLIGSDAGTSLKTMLQRLQNPSEEAATTMASLGVSMYDANGEFVGMEALAGQLKDGMNGMTPAARDAAMAVIFGSDAVRAANVLYKEGADGIGDWTSKVNDAGYAAEQAAMLQDNLKGDLEKLGGAWETLMISLGSGSQGPLRELVQGLTLVLDGVLALGGPLGELGGWAADNMEIVAALATVLAIQLVGGIGAVQIAMSRFVLTPIVLGVTTLIGAIGGLPAALAAAGGAIGGFMAAAAPLVAIGGLVYAISKTVAFATAAGDARDEVRDMWDAVDDARGGAQLDALGGVVEQLRDKVAELRENLSDDGAWESTILGGMISGAIEDTKSLEEYEKALKAAEEAQAGAARTANSLGREFGLNRQQVLDLAEKYNIDLTDGTQNAYMQFQAFYTTEYGDSPRQATQRLIDSLNTMGDVAATAEQRIDALKTALDILGGKEVSVFEASSALQQVVDSAATAIEGLSGNVLDADGNLNAYSESGRAAGDVLVNIRDKGNDLITTMVEQGYTLDEVRAADNELRESFIRSATQMGISQDAARRLADQILGVPSDRETRFTAATDQAAARIAALQAQIDAVSRDRTATINFRATLPDLNGVASGSGRMGTAATGGYIRGPGTGTSDDVPMWLSNGEYVVRASSVEKYGRSFFDGLNAGHMADGGLVSLVGQADTSGASAGLSQTMNTLGISVEAAARRLAASLEPPQASGGSSTGLLPIMAAARQYVMDTYGVRNIGGFARRNIAGTNTLSDHAMGKAIDIMTTNLPLGWAIANDFAYGAARGRFRAENVIWQQSISSNGGPFRGMANRGSPTQNHMDHVHVDTYDQGGILRHGRMGINLSGSPERVLNPKETVAYEAGMRSREFSGSGSRAPIVIKVTPNLEGARISGQVSFDPSGVLRLTDARIEAMFGEIADTVHYAGG